MIMGILDSLVSGVGNFIPGFNSMMHPEEGYEAAAKKMQQFWQQAMGFQQPYNQAGLGQLPTLTSAEGALLNPAALLKQWMGQYEMSPYAQKSLGNAKEAGLDAASTMGLMGSSSALGNIQQSASDIMNADRQNFLNDLMQKYMTGIGIGQDIYGRGAGMAAELGKEALGVGENLGQAAYGAKNAPGDVLRNLLSMAGKMAMQNQIGGVA